MMKCRLVLLLWCSCLLPSSGNTLGQENSVVVVAAEGSDVILPCSLSSKENIEYKAFDWKKQQQTTQNKQEVFFYDHGSYYGKGRQGQDVQFEGRVSHFPDELKFGNASITIKKTKKTDSGKYTCYFPTVQPRQLFHIDLVVEGSGVITEPKDRSGELPGAAKPFITSVYNSVEMVQLQCEVQGASLKPNLHWEDSEGNILDAEKPKETERGGSYDIILQTTVTKTGDYHCVVTQEQINHRAGTRTHVFISGKQPCTYGIGEIIGFVGGSVVLLVVGWLLGASFPDAILCLPAVKCFRNICRSCQRNTSHDADHPVKDNMSTDNDPASQCMLEMKQANGANKPLSVAESA